MSTSARRDVSTSWRSLRTSLELDGNEREDFVRIDQNFVVQGHEKYREPAKNDYFFYVARMNLILGTYNLTSEYELISGYHLCPGEERQNNDSVRTANLDFQLLVEETQARFDQENLRCETSESSFRTIFSRSFSDKEKVQKASAWYFIAIITDRFSVSAG